MVTKSKRGTSKKKSKRKPNLKVIILAVALLMLSALAWLFLTESGRHFGRNTIPYFKRIEQQFFSSPYVPIADAYCIDVSRFQGDINWAELSTIPYNVATRRQGKKEKTASSDIVIVFVKATEGADFVDTKSQANQQGVRSTNIKYGAYHVMTMAPVPDQFQNFITNSGLVKGDIRPVIDLEESILANHKPAIVRQNLKELVALLKKHYGVRPIIYASHNFGSLIIDSELAHCPLWVARYGVANPPEHADIWQFAENGSIPGVFWPVDLDAIYFNRFKINDLLIK